jgi:hypothetical protein
MSKHAYVACQLEQRIRQLLEQEFTANVIDRGLHRSALSFARCGFFSPSGAIESWRIARPAAKLCSARHLP